MVLRKIVSFYNKYENLNLKIAFFLISLQIIHLYWLTTDVVLLRIFGETFFAFPQIPPLFFAIIDYIEVPALVSGVTFYAMRIYRKGIFSRDTMFLAMLAMQVFHIFWITDEIIYENLIGRVAIGLPIALSWVAIIIDYLELPVMVDLFRKVFRRKV
jgi:hypothetical protein